MLINALAYCRLNFSFEWLNGQGFFYGIRFREANPTARREQPTRRERSAGRSAQNSVLQRFPTPSYGVLQDYIMSAPDSSVSVSRVKKLYKALASEDDVPFSKFLQDMLDKHPNLSKITKTKNSGDPQECIMQLALTQKGQEFLNKSK
jgi:hypothetical protein